MPKHDRTAWPEETASSTSFPITDYPPPFPMTRSFFLLPAVPLQDMGVETAQRMPTSIMLLHDVPPQVSRIADY